MRGCFEATKQMDLGPVHEAFEILHRNNLIKLLSDGCRLLLLYLFGNTYVDNDAQPFFGLRTDSVLGVNPSADVVLVQSVMWHPPHITMSFMRFRRPHHPLIQKVLKDMTLGIVKEHLNAEDKFTCDPLKASFSPSQLMYFYARNVETATRRKEKTRHGGTRVRTVWQGPPLARMPRSPSRCGAARRLRGYE
jgi:hypothetical protein